mmetsp:Transcript_19776/g.62920  ORF Transcript_19776/g.62920 Transcript_19776/m.62920 type:complete len:283 (-) Transcript_19776:467-1315(-)
MTVRPEKSTRFPLRFPLNRPCLPLSRCTNPRSGFPGPWKARGSPGSSELMYIAHDTCRKSQFSMRLTMVATPRSMVSRRMLFTSMICISFIVMSSSLLPAALSISTLGRMHTGGTGRCVMSRCSGRPLRSSTSQSSWRMRSNSPSTLMGLRSSCTFPRLARSPSLCLTASSNSFWNASIRGGFLAYLSCTILRVDPAFFTTPWLAPHRGHLLLRLQRSASFLYRARRCRISMRGFRNRRRYPRLSSSGSSTRAQVLQMHCKIDTTFLKYPMWNTGSSSLMYP